MQKPTLALLAALLLPACTANVTDAPPATGTGGSGGSGGSSPVATSGCSFTVSGAVDAVAGPLGGELVSTVGGEIECGIVDVAGQNHVVLAAIGAYHGPGQYVSVGEEGYQWVHCSDPSSTCPDVENFAASPQGGHCVFTLTVAPASQMDAIDDPIAGTFSCTDLVDQSDPTRVVSIQHGAFWGTLGPEPD